MLATISWVLNLNHTKKRSLRLNARDRLSLRLLLFVPAHDRRGRSCLAACATEAGVIAIDMPTRPASPLGHRLARTRYQRRIRGRGSRRRDRDGSAERGHSSRYWLLRWSVALLRHRLRWLDRLRPIRRLRRRCGWRHRLAWHASMVLLRQLIR